MERRPTTTTPPTPPDAAEVVFTVEQANRSLVLVSRVVGDIAASYARLMELRSQRQQMAAEIARAEDLPRLQTDIDATVEQLSQLHNELAAIGCVLKDWAGGLVDFPAVHEGRRVWLCWRLGEPSVTHWHELEGGFAGRHPIGPDFA
ncbi:MAG: DUF2203 domain-containing protein [Phycisphaerae bacterium]|jgi:hypothetical protein